MMQKDPVEESETRLYTVEEVRVGAKRELFRAGPRMRFVMPRISVRVSTWILNNAPAVTPNQVTLVSALLGLGAAALLLAPSGLLPPIAAFFVYQLHILADYVDGELARVKDLASVKGAYYDLMVGRVTKPAVLYAAAIGTWLGHRDGHAADLDLILGALIVAGFLLDKEAVDVWYRANMGRGELEDPYVVRSDRALRGGRRVVTRILVGLRSIPAFLVYQIIAALAIELGFDHVNLFGAYEATPRSLILILFAISFPTLALSRSIYIARTGHIPRRQDLVRDD
jgi:phosphatidylglycerophosphate synthase